jgi:hypothetical protein
MLWFDVFPPMPAQPAAPTATTDAAAMSLSFDRLCMDDPLHERCLPYTLAPTALG